MTAFEREEHPGVRLVTTVKLSGNFVEVEVRWLSGEYVEPLTASQSFAVESTYHLVAPFCDVDSWLETVRLHFDPYRPEGPPVML